jgi:hypothetical protein
MVSSFGGRTAVVSLLAALMIACSNPMSVDVALQSPTGFFIAEVISHDVSAVTDVKGQREFVVILRGNDEERDFESQTVLRVLGAEVPSLRWTPENALKIELAKATEVVEDKSSSGRRISVSVSMSRLP